MNRFVIRGARGTSPACARDFLRFGGNTTCFSIESDDGIVIIDAGTGLTNVANEIEAGRGGQRQITFLFTHLHMDHLMGFPCFAPFYDADASLTLMADPGRSSNWREDLHSFMNRPFWPVGLYESDAAMRLVDLPLGDGRLDLYGMRFTWMRLPHPQGCVGYRVTVGSRQIVVATDVEYEAGKIDPAFCDFCRGADTLIMDAQYTPEEYAAHRGWGHSAWPACVEAARGAGVGSLILTHHAPSRRDDAVAAIADAARERLPGTLAAAENMELAG